MPYNRYYESSTDTQNPPTYAAPSPTVVNNIPQAPPYGGQSTTQVNDRSNPPPNTSTGPVSSTPGGPVGGNNGTVIGAAGNQQQAPQQVDRSQYRDMWMGGGATNLQMLKDFLAKYGGQLISDNGTVMTPYGETLDMLIGSRGQMAGQGNARPGWTGVNTGYAAPNNLPNSINNTINQQTNQEPVKENYAAARPQIATMDRLINQNRSGQFNPYFTGR